MDDKPLEVLYDGSCRLCTAEVERLKNRGGQDQFVFVDITSPRFDESTYGRSKAHLMKSIHVRDSEGKFYRGLDGIIRIQRSFPPNSRSDLFGRALSLPILYQVSKGAYRLLARYRHLLPKRRRCEKERQERES